MIESLEYAMLSFALYISQCGTHFETKFSQTLDDLY